jgi:hypothetical protein
VKLIQTLHQTTQAIQTISNNSSALPSTATSPTQSFPALLSTYTQLSQQLLQTLPLFEGRGCEASHYKILTSLLQTEITPTPPSMPAMPSILPGEARSIGDRFQSALSAREAAIKQQAARSRVLGGGVRRVEMSGVLRDQGRARPPPAFRPPPAQPQLQPAPPQFHPPPAPPQFQAPPAPPQFQAPPAQPGYAQPGCAQPQHSPFHAQSAPPPSPAAAPLANPYAAQSYSYAAHA